jgi:hypothetical protein
MFRVCCFDPFFWRNGLLITLGDGRAFYLSVTRPEAALDELRSLMPMRNAEAVEQRRAA